MTSEVALLNRWAIALAADSATTASYFERGERKTRFFKGAKKIFHLTPRFPIALMTYDAENLLGIPWGTIVAGYRDRYPSIPLNFVHDYATDFFRYVESNLGLYAQATMEAQLSADVVESAGLILRMADPEGIAVTEGNRTKRVSMLERRMEKVTSDIASSPFIHGFSEDDVSAILGQWETRIIDGITQDPFVMARAEGLDMHALASLGAQALLKKRSTILPASGLVFAGFGDQEFFPALEHYTCYGVVVGRLIRELGGAVQISQKNPSELLPFAQSDMSRGFLYGVRPSVTARVNSNLTKALEHYDELLREAGLVTGGLSEEIKAKVHERFSECIESELMLRHTLPTKQIVGFLPPDELADLAEMLVRMESLKERFTRDTESVSGPIRVSVISKTDGFVLITRQATALNGREYRATNL